MDVRWTLPDKLPPLAMDRLQVWRINLGIGETISSDIGLLLHQAYAVLSEAERERAARMRIGGPREEFLAGRGCLRRLLGGTLDSDPRTLILETGSHGKPFLRPNLGGTAPDFNVAHSHGVILIGLSTVGAVGVDVEYLDPELDFLDIARTAFHADDLARLQRASTPEERLSAFYRCWTRKEAVAKADGRGLSLEPTSFAAGTDSDDEQKVVIPDSRDATVFHVRSLSVGKSHYAALATEGPRVSASCYELSPQFPLLFAE